MIESSTHLDSFDDDRITLVDFLRNLAAAAKESFTPGKLESTYSWQASLLIANGNPLLQGNVF